MIGGYEAVAAVVAFAAEDEDFLCGRILAGDEGGYGGAGVFHEGGDGDWVRRGLGGIAVGGGHVVGGENLHRDHLLRVREWDGISVGEVAEMYSPPPLICANSSKQGS